MKKLCLILPLLLLVACNPTFIQNAYIAPNGDCGYVVRLGGLGGEDQQISKCLTLEDARNLAAQINKDMGDKWNGRPR